ncbi:MAG: S1/P1 nuclease [Armatimonadetes bacterium]|nr:S1/P1 nuclease [Armatimonadota bacterium]
MSRRLILFLAIAAAATPSQAWLASGHEQIADIAWTQLSQSARKEVAEILQAGDKDFVPASDSEADVRAAFRRSATWADWIKQHKEGIFEPEILAWNAKFQPDYDANDPNGEAHRCKRWHYFDVPVRYGGPKPGVESSNALVCLTVARYEFSILNRQSTKDRKTQCWWLYWMEHVIGDLHQPLHCVSDHKYEVTGDAGGNLFKLGVGTPENPDRMMNLHFMWDRGIATAVTADFGSAAKVDDVSAKWSELYKPTEQDARNLDFEKWIDAGAKLSVSAAYDGIERDGKPSDEYMKRLNDVARRQAVLAGFRLAREIELGLGTLKPD